MQHLDHFSLHLFILVCEEGTIARASQRAFIAPSAVSKRISDIEARFGTPLFKRSKRGVEPTPAGQALLRHARSLTRAMERLDSELSEYAEGARGHVRVLANVSSIMEFLPEELSDFMLNNPRIQADIEERFSPEVVRGVAEGNADLGICRQSMAVGDLEFLPYRQDHLAVVVSATHPLADHTRITFEETLAFDHLGLSAFATLNTFMREEAKKQGRELRFRSYVSSFDAAFRLLQFGLGLAVFPLEAVARYAQLFDLRVIPLADDWALGEFVICVRDREALSLSARRLLDHLLLRAPPRQTAR
ncbi:MULTISPECIES: LysR family transcriptional regulator [unclassified Pseudomonas]|uniref:LysR family transcriptional regulator n=1 Tax=unclassified Pseudomonas TaxID=196821 RepID=UPI00087622B2|nr:MULTISPECIES: LysR family transcriptional regulator [unclassified Pseudomonas]SCZ31517.1 DNA-binding transcriptional regulator, LysR family [Pseudomonas sp. NFACC44-2]SDA42888.1 DNA-binding transcriptional regulator, LysR family [Pseudomonas sp. NFACC51]SDX84481.1 DNA-binding transcriptional regulator, LysR family [Pseudomonas sp. NFACC08-1]SFH55431.1 DNA-binding transcriptional regulator, LysR family [Pseudomonas sp. NFACC54]SFT04724.1 DNA-binding transcriptional regulator, LysR family [Ps